jgi:steroid 5-alpha reductase family enzyme
VLNSGETSMRFPIILAVIVTLSAIIIESIADKQLADFKNEGSGHGEIMRRGMWAYSRHPNYFGEILFWWGLYLFALATEPRFWWTVIGPLVVTILFVIVSVPIMDKRSLVSRPGYAEHMKKVSGVIPWFPRK